MPGLQDASWQVPGPDLVGETRCPTSNGSTAIHVIREFEEIDTDDDHVLDAWQWTKDTVWRDGTLLAADAGDGFIRHYHTDHLGSLRLVTGSPAKEVPAE